MPYMSCNGRTVSRYDTSPEVDQCKADEDEAYQKWRTECLASPECAADMERSQQVAGGFLCLAVVILLAIIIAVIVSLWSNGNE